MEQNAVATETEATKIPQWVKPLVIASILTTAGCSSQEGLAVVDALETGLGLIIMGGVMALATEKGANKLCKDYTGYVLGIALSLAVTLGANEGSDPKVWALAAGMWGGTVLSIFTDVWGHDHQTK